jgi:hypothetical protein
VVPHFKNSIKKRKAKAVVIPVIHNMKGRNPITESWKAGKQRHGHSSLFLRRCGRYVAFDCLVFELNEITLYGSESK